MRKVPFSPIFEEFEKSPHSEAKWRIPADLTYFEGHFPENPILPAVAIIDASIDFARQSSGNESLQLKALKNAKFLGPMTPNAVVKISLKAQEDEFWKLEWTTEEGKSLAKIEMCLG